MMIGSNSWLPRNEALNHIVKGVHHKDQSFVFGGEQDNLHRMSTRLGLLQIHADA
jgi:hypothetical protein